MGWGEAGRTALLRFFFQMVIHHLSNPGHLTSMKFCSNEGRLNDLELINYLYVKPRPPDFGSIVAQSR